MSLGSNVLPLEINCPSLAFRVIVVCIGIYQFYSLYVRKSWVKCYCKRSLSASFILITVPNALFRGISMSFLIGFSRPPGNHPPGTQKSNRDNILKVREGHLLSNFRFFYYALFQEFTTKGNHNTPQK